MTHGTIIETTTPTYNWATAAGAVASISGLVALAVCISVSVANRTTHGYAPVPTGVTALAVVMTLGGLVLVLFRILHADREATDRRVDAIVERLEKIDEKLNQVWGIAARTSIEARPARTERHAPRQRRRRGQRGGDERDAESAPVPDNVVPLSSQRQRAKDALRRLTERLTKPAGE